MTEAVRHYEDTANQVKGDGIMASSAKALGLTIRPALLARAYQLLE
jgi:hypothetical protein